MDLRPAACQMDHFLLHLVVAEAVEVAAGLFVAEELVGLGLGT